VANGTSTGEVSYAKQVKHARKFCQTRRPDRSDYPLDTGTRPESNPCWETRARATLTREIPDERCPRPEDA
jgi:hypothetical protein